MTVKEIKNCNCGKIHKVNCVIKSGCGVIASLPELLIKFECGKAFILSDINTEEAAGKKVKKILSENKIEFSEYIFNSISVKPNEEFLGNAIMHFDKECNVIIGVGSGVINDICKIIANITEKKYIIVATAPSMDGYASATSSVERDGLKFSLNSKMPDAIIGDIDILKNAPKRMMLAGLGDMIAKYVSICEWRISNLVTDEYYCENIAQLVRNSLKLCIDNAENLLSGNDEAVQSVFDGLINTGVAMSFAGLSRPASGTEHYFSHIWDMRSLEFGNKSDFHGIQCAIGTLETIKIYEQFKNIKPDIDKAKNNIDGFNIDNWNNTLKELIGKGASAMIMLEEKEHKYDKKRVLKNAEKISEHFNEIKSIIEKELPDYTELKNLYKKIGMPTTANEIGIDDDIKTVFSATKDIRDKYILSRMCFELGITDEMNFS